MDNRLRVGVIGCSRFALRAMMPALAASPVARLVAVASRTASKAEAAAAPYGVPAVAGYDVLLEREDVDAVYIPLPTGLHEEWCAKALAAGKHILVEKSFATNARSACQLVDEARARRLLIMENFQFQTHSQWHRLRTFMSSGEIGDVHLIRSTFGFPPLPRDDFRWNPALGGGALLDVGAYMAKVSLLLLGKDLEVRGASMSWDSQTGADIYGEAMMRNSAGQVAQVAYGFDYFYQCRLELLGTRGKVSTGRVFTAPPDLAPKLMLETEEGAQELVLPKDNHYANMWRWFAETIKSGEFEPHWTALLEQARLLDSIKEAALK
jgi:predicted dehydrogenase